MKRAFLTAMFQCVIVLFVPQLIWSGANLGATSSGSEAAPHNSVKSFVTATMRGDRSNNQQVYTCTGTYLGKPLQQSRSTTLTVHCKLFRFEFRKSASSLISFIFPSRFKSVVKNPGQNQSRSYPFFFRLSDCLAMNHRLSSLMRPLSPIQNQTIP